jgi:hypothetical protein
LHNSISIFELFEELNDKFKQVEPLLDKNGNNTITKIADFFIINRCCLDLLKIINKIDILLFDLLLNQLISDLKAHSLNLNLNKQIEIDSLLKLFNLITFRFQLNSKNPKHIFHYISDSEQQYKNFKSFLIHFQHFALKFNKAHLQNINFKNDFNLLANFNIGEGD